MKNKAELLDSLFTTLFKKGRFNGNVLIAEKGKVIFRKSFGYSNLGKKIPLDIFTTFELGSITKQFTAFAILKLANTNKINFDDDFSKYLPELGFYKNVKISNLLYHTGGLPDFEEVMEKYFDHTKIATNEDVIKTFKKWKPEVYFQANEKWQYSNTGYVFLATIIERITGVKYEDYIKEIIFKPLGMNNSFVNLRYLHPKEVANNTLGYVRSSITHKKIQPETEKEFEDYIYLGGVYGDGMINTNVDDLLLWDRGLYNENFITKDQQQLLFTPSILNNGKIAGKSGEYSYGYGLGWKLPSFKFNKKYGKVVQHGGEWIGFVGYIERHIDNDKTIIFLQNYKEGLFPVKRIREILYM